MHPEKSIITRCFALFAACFLLLNAVDALVPGDEAKVFSEVIRLHVLADGDGGEQQRVKLLVRDAVLAEYSALLGEARGAEEAEEAAKRCIPGIKQTADRVLAENGVSYRAQVFLVRENYPARDYGGISLPAGEYKSLKIVLGSGSGQNWWCVMFPPLCFGAAGTGMENTRVGEKSAQVFKNKKYVFRFKLLELFG
ncbi:MAG: stage II sporulation protein R [Clostridia bacterium]|nr:stage II sporulation protein R [Clostridia bacterium]